MIIKIDWPSKERTESLQDYHRQNNLLQSAYLKRQSTYPVDGATLVQGFVFQIRGEVFIVAQPETIRGETSPYIQITPPSSIALEATAQFVDSLDGVDWDDSFAGYYDQGGKLYIFDEAAALSAGEITQTHKISQSYMATSGDQDIYGVKRFQDTSNLEWGNIWKVGDSLPIPEMTIASATPISSTKIAAIVDDSNVLKIYEKRDGAWSVTSNLAIPTLLDETKPVSIATLKEDIVVITNGTTLHTFQILTSGLQRVATPFTSGQIFSDVAVLDGGRAVTIDITGLVRLLQLERDTWVEYINYEIGEESDNYHITTIDNSQAVVLRGEDLSIRTLLFGSTSCQQIGDTFNFREDSTSEDEPKDSISEDEPKDCIGLNTTDIMVVDTEKSMLRLFRADKKTDGLIWDILYNKDVLNQRIAGVDIWDKRFVLTDAYLSAVSNVRQANRLLSGISVDSYAWYDWRAWLDIFEDKVRDAQRAFSAGDLPALQVVARGIGTPIRFLRNSLDDLRTSIAGELRVENQKLETARNALKAAERRLAQEQSYTPPTDSQLSQLQSALDALSAVQSDVSAAQSAVSAAQSAVNAAAAALSEAHDAFSEAEDAAEEAGDASSETLDALLKADDDAYSEALDAHNEAAAAYSEAVDAFSEAGAALSEAHDAFSEAEDAAEEAESDLNSAQADLIIAEQIFESEKQRIGIDPNWTEDGVANAERALKIAQSNFNSAASSWNRKKRDSDAGGEAYRLLQNVAIGAVIYTETSIPNKIIALVPLANNTLVVFKGDGSSDGELTEYKINQHNPPPAPKPHSIFLLEAMT